MTEVKALDLFPVVNIETGEKRLNIVHPKTMAKVSFLVKTGEDNLDYDGMIKALTEIKASGQDWRKRVSFRQHHMEDGSVVDYAVLSRYQEGEKLDL